MCIMFLMLLYFFFLKLECLMFYLFVFKLSFIVFAFPINVKQTLVLYFEKVQNFMIFISMLKIYLFY